MFTTITETPQDALRGPKGWGDLGYDEIEIIRPRLFEHRMLFSSSVELQVRFADFTLAYQDKLDDERQKALAGCHTKWP